MKPACTFIGWDEPLVVAVAAWLRSGRTTQPPDLSDTLVLVPTQQAGRRLREVLARSVSGQAVGLWSPRVVPPSGLLALPTRPAAASALEMDAVWLELLRQLRMADYPALFPVTPAVQDTAWALPLARALRRLRATVSEAGLLIRDVAGLSHDQLPEPERWEDLARLEGEFLHRLTCLDRADPVRASIASARNPTLPPGIARVVVAGVPDLAPLYAGALTALAESVAVHVLVAAPPAAALLFDEWGRPRPDAWARQEIALPTEPGRLALCAGPAGQARRVAAWLDEESARFGFEHAAIGVPDPDVVAPLAAVLGERGLRTYDPAGRPAREHPVVQLVEAAGGLAVAGDYAAFRAFARHADVLAAVAAEHQAEPADVLAQLDFYQNEFLPTRFDEMRSRLKGATAESEAGALARVVEFAGRFLDTLATQPPEEALRDLLQQVYGSRSIEPASPRGEAFIEVGRIVGDSLAELGRLQAGAAGLTAEDFFALLSARLRDERWYPERADAALDLDGWLELSWSDAPLVLLTGVNEGILPEGQLADVFLPDSLRTRLGLRDDALRMARDAFLLKSLLASRRRSGCVAIALGRTSAAGDALKPSRLLFRCADGDLPARCRRLFGEVADPRPRPAVTVPFQLRPERASAPDPLERLRVTGFRSYLACPFRFYLCQVLGMEEQDDRKLELDAGDFGTLLHRALQALAESESLRSCAEEDRVADFLCEEVVQLARRRFGAQPPLQVVFQIESAQQRLRAAAAHHVAAVAEGWEVLAAEQKFAGEVGGFPVRGRIDRVERNRHTGVLRVLDYKSADRAETPEATHLGTAGEATRDYARVTVGKRGCAWRDLQLPLYAQLLRNDSAFTGFRQIEIGYFNLPKAVADTGIAVWAEFSPALAESAARCAEGVAHDIGAGRFWPPAERVAYDDYERLFFGPVPEYVDAGRLNPGPVSGGVA